MSCWTVIKFIPPQNLDNFLHFNYTEIYGCSVKTFKGYAYFFELSVELIFQQNLTTTTTTLHLSISLCGVNATREKVS